MGKRNKVIDGFKVCAKCGVNKPVSNYHISPGVKPGGLVVYSYCRPCHAAMQRERNKRDAADRDRTKAEAGRMAHVPKDMQYRLDRWERVKTRAREAARQTRLDTLSHYSRGEMACACCGERTVQFLSLDHINNDGAEHRRQTRQPGGGDTNIFKWAKKHGYPPMFQVLCMNCNMAKGMYGSCPHEQERERKTQQLGSEQPHLY